MNLRHKGNDYEDQAEAYLKSAGYRILCRNFRCRAGEIDIIGRDGSYLVFIEVKYRLDESRGLPEEAVDRRKIYRICRTADYYRMVRKVPEDLPCRFDVVCICGKEMKLIKDAFSYCY
ncbi:YraN family protein [Diplocloster modestus]|uniref:UPF0102 protein KTH90_18095 n=1 Tax=Diplocloster modestus TaxID=2850322 RepID=A0ABS6KBM3_9FIRM|nr:YraN family protein [Diplocloster modestus]MBU9727924.1 YraN family protein [Diplocloster modestus]